MKNLGLATKLSLFVAFLTTITVVPQLLDPYNLPKLLILTLGIGVILALTIREAIVSFTGKQRFIHIVPISVFALFLSSGIKNNQNYHQIFLGTYQRNLGLLAYLIFAFFFIIFAANKKLIVAEQFMHLLAILGALLTVIGYYQRNEALKISPAKAAVSVSTTLGNIDMAAAMLGMTATATIYLLLRSGTKKVLRLILIISYYGHYNLLFDSPAKQGRVLMVLGSVLVIGFWLFSRKEFWIRKLAIGYWIGIINVAILSVFSVFGHGPLRNLFLSESVSIEERIRFSKAAIAMARDNLLFGVGVDAFGDWFRRYQTLQDFEAIKAAGAGNVDNPHNVLMHMFATGGLPLLSFYVLLNAFVLYRSVILFSKFQDKYLAGGVFVVWIAFQAQSLVSIDQVSITSWGWIAAGILVGLSFISGTESNSKDQKSKILSTPSHLRSWKLTAVPIFIVLIQVPTVYLFQVMNNHIDLGNSVDKLRITADQAQFDKNSESVLKAALSNREPYLRVMSVRLLNDFGKVDSMVVLSEDTVKRFPNYFEGWDTLASIYEQTGRKELSIEPRKKSIELDPLNNELKRLLAADKN